MPESMSHVPQNEIDKFNIATSKKIEKLTGETSKQVNDAFDNAKAEDLIQMNAWIKPEAEEAPPKKNLIGEIKKFFSKN